MLDVIHHHADNLTSTISLELTYFSNQFIKKSFTTQGAANAVLNQQGVSDSDKASQLLNHVTVNYKISRNKQAWAEDFIAIFSSQAAYEDLATTLRREAFPAQP